MSEGVFIVCDIDLDSEKDAKGGWVVSFVSADVEDDREVSACVPSWTEVQWFFFFFFGLEGTYDGKELHVRVRVYDNVGIFLG